MFYKFDKKGLQFIKVKWLGLGLKISAVLAIFLLVIVWNIRHSIRNEFAESEVMVILTKHNEFTPEKFEKMVKDLHFRFPHIVYAQALLETGNFKMKIFIENNNIFSMKEATQRIHTSKGTQYGHAYYDTWMESLYDYALYYATYLTLLKTEEDYFNYLAINYAEDKEYVKKLKEIIVTENLISKFN